MPVRQTWAVPLRKRSPPECWVRQRDLGRLEEGAIFVVQQQAASFTAREWSPAARSPFRARSPGPYARPPRSGCAPKPFGQRDRGQRGGPIFRITWPRCSFTVTRRPSPGIVVGAAGHRGPSPPACVVTARPGAYERGEGGSSARRRRSRSMAASTAASRMSSLHGFEEPTALPLLARTHGHVAEAAAKMTAVERRRLERFLNEPAAAGHAHRARGSLPANPGHARRTPASSRMRSTRRPAERSRL